MTQAYIYIGPMTKVTPCEFKDRPPCVPICLDGSCPGEVNGKCCFSMGKPNANGEGLFKEFNNG